MKRKHIFYSIGISLTMLLLVLTSTSCASKSYYAKGKSKGYSKVRGKQPGWNSTTSLNTTYKLKKKKNNAGSVKK